MVSTQNKLQYVCVCVYVRDNEGICHPNPVWLTDVFLIVFGKQWRSMAQGSTIKKKTFQALNTKRFLVIILIMHFSWHSLTVSRI